MTFERFSSGSPRLPPDEQPGPPPTAPQPDAPIEEPTETPPTREEPEPAEPSPSDAPMIAEGGRRN